MSELSENAAYAEAAAELMRDATDGRRSLAERRHGSRSAGHPWAPPRRATRVLYFGSREWLDVPKGWTAAQVKREARERNRLVLGPRREDIERALQEDRQAFGDIVIIEGEADGADITTRILARRMGISVEPYPVTKEEWDRLGKKAGHIRNERMLRTGINMARGFIVGCLGEDMSLGSADMLRQLLTSGAEVILRRDDGVKVYEAR